jgi:acyl carrier protein
MLRFVEPRVRQVVADHLGIDEADLTPEVSLTDDLAADSLDLLELTLGLEQELSIRIPESMLASVRTYGDLVAAAEALCRNAVQQAEVAEESPPLVWARVVPPRERAQGDVQHAGWLTPYTAQAIAEDALRTGRGTKLEVTIPATAPDTSLGRLSREFAWLGPRGVEVSVRRQERQGPGSAAARPHAAA